jgi:hypothetical protein
MSIPGFNTYGLHSVNGGTFNQNVNSSLTYPKEVRDVIVTGLRIHNLALRVMEYLPSTFIISGALRMCTGAAMIGATLAIGERDAQYGAIIGRYYDEALNTGAVQMARGALTLTGPIGVIANVIFDLLATGMAVNQSIHANYTTYAYGAAPLPHKEPLYPFPLNILFLG